MSNNNNSGGISFLGALAILFIGLKLGKIIMWGWPWVLAPLWMPVVAFILAALVGFLMVVTE